MAQRSCKEQRRILDEATRMRRARKALESLESDNFHEDPHADLVMSKKALTLFQDSEETKKNKKKLRTTEYYKQR
jgi:zinc finger HIT domain-containing protein 1